MPIQSTYNGTGSLTDFTVGFDYTSRDFVKVYLSDVLQVSGTDYNFISDTQVRFTTAPPSGTDNVKLQRVTSTTLLVDFAAGASIQDTDLDLVNEQLAHIAEEQASEGYVDAQIAEALITPSTTISSYMGPILGLTNQAAVLSALGGTATGQLVFTAPSGGAALTTLGVSTQAAIALAQLTDEAIRDSLEVKNDVPVENLVLNGDFQVAQNGTAFAAPNDDTYTFDQWVILQEVNGAVDVDRLAAAEVAGTPGKEGVRVSMNIANRDWGLFQPIEASKVHSLRGETVTLSYWARYSGSPNFRAHLVSWAGTADSPTTDIVGTWNGTSVPTPATNWTFVEPDTVDEEEVILTIGWVKYSATYTVPSGANNLGVFLGSNWASAAIGNRVDLTAVNLTRGEFANAFESRPFEDELRACQRFFVKTFEPDVTPADSAGFAGALHAWATQMSTSYGLFSDWELPTPLVKTPTVTLYNPSAGTAGRYAKTDATTRGTDPSTDDSTVRITVRDASTTPMAALDSYYIHAAADARF